MKVGQRIAAMHLLDGSDREGEILKIEDHGQGAVAYVRFDGQYFVNANPVDAGSDMGCFKQWYFIEDLTLADNQEGCYWLWKP